jgi:hypothetical protein
MPTAVVTIDLSDDFIGHLADAMLARLKPGTAGAVEAIADAKAEARRATQADPWGETWPDAPADDETPAEPATAPARGGSGPAPARTGTQTDNKGRVWTFGAPGAPDCQCGEPAVMVKGLTNGKGWTQYRCARDYDDYKNKCQFSQFASKGK